MKTKEQIRWENNKKRFYHINIGQWVLSTENDSEKEILKKIEELSFKVRVPVLISDDPRSAVKDLLIYYPEKKSLVESCNQAIEDGLINYYDRNSI